MRIFLQVAMFLPLLAGSGCTTREGALVSPEAGTGLLVIREKNALPARIFVDGEPTGRDTRQGAPLSLPLGRHVVRLMLGRHRASPESLVVDLGAEGREAEFEMLPAPSGHLKVGSRPGGAAVFIDGMRMGATPPDPAGTLEVTDIPAGPRRVELRYGNFAAEQVVVVEEGRTAALEAPLILHRHALVEDFTNTSCDGCPEVAGMIRENLRLRGDRRVLALEVHASFPSPNDPLHQAARAPLLFLERLYAPDFLPAVYCNGAKLDFGQDIRRVPALLDSALASLAGTPAIVNLVLMPGGRAQGSVRVEAVGGPIGKARLRVALFQGQVVFPSPPGTNRQTEFHNVVRALLEEGAGRPVELAQGGQATVDYAFDLSGLPSEGLSVVAYLQRESDRVILQSIHGPLGQDHALPAGGR